MSEQNSYRIVCDYKRHTEWSGWIDNHWWSAADTWQDAIQKWLDRAWPAEDYTVVSETPSGDGRSGIIEIQFAPTGFNAAAKVKATIIED